MIGPPASREHLTMSRNIFAVIAREQGGLLASSRWRPRVLLLNVLRAWDKAYQPHVSTVLRLRISGPECFRMLCVSFVPHRGTWWVACWGISSPPPSTPGQGESLQKNLPPGQEARRYPVQLPGLPESCRGPGRLLTMRSWGWCHAGSPGCSALLPCVVSLGE